MEPKRKKSLRIAMLVFHLRCEGLPVNRKVVCEQVDLFNQGVRDHRIADWTFQCATKNGIEIFTQ